MKRGVTIFQRSTFTSFSNGTVKKYVCSPEIWKMLGQAINIRYQFIGFRKSANVQIQLKIFESPCDEIPAHEVMPGTPPTPFFTGTMCNILRPAPEMINGPFSHNVVAILEVSDSTTTAMEEWDGYVAATAILEE